MYGRGRLDRPGTRLLDGSVRSYATPTMCATRLMFSEVEAAGLLRQATRRARASGKGEMVEGGRRGGGGGSRRWREREVSNKSV